MARVKKIHFEEPDPQLVSRVEAKSHLYYFGYLPEHHFHIMVSIVSAGTIFQLELALRGVEVL